MTTRKDKVHLTPDLDQIVDEMVDGLLEQDGGIREPGKADRQYPEHDALTHHNDPEPADQDEDIPLTDELKAKIIQAAIPLAIKLGTENGKGVAGWVEQDTWGGRVTRGEREAAQAVLKGIEDGDPAVLDDLPRPNAGDKSDIMNELLDDAAWAVDKLELSDEEKTELLDEADEVWDEYIMAYTRALQDELVRMARAFLKEEE